MCGRYHFQGSVEALQDALDLSPKPPPGQPRYNIAPSQSAPVIRATATGYELTLLQWGLVPHWAKDRKAVKPQINARSETVHEKPFFRDAFRSGRCLIPADGFFEWQRQGDRKQPFCIGLGDRATFCFAGLWARNTKGAPAPLETFTILTCAPNALMQPIHNRMPVILSPQDYEAWLTGPPAEVTTRMQPYTATAMEAYPISDRVNTPRNDDPSILEAIAVQ